MILALLLQLVFVLFVPPISLGNRSLFLSDVWLLIWPTWLLFLGWKRSAWNERRSTLIMLGSTGVILLVAYAHGAARAQLLEPLLRAGLTSNENGGFDRLRELVVVFRFWSWLAAAVAVRLYWSRIPLKRSRELLRQLTFGLLAFTAISAALVVLARLHHPLESVLGRIYGYNPNLIDNGRRARGCFLSPNEAGLSLVLSGMLFWTMSSCLRLRDRMRIPVTSLILLASLPTEAATPLIASAISYLVTLVQRARRVGLAVVVSTGLTVLFLALWESGNLPLIVQYKLGHFGGRVDPWLVYLKTALSRWDYLLFGTGFNSFYVDNFFVFVFNRAGLLALVPLLAWIWSCLARNWSRWNMQQRTLVVFSLLCSCTLDTFVLRPFAALWITLAIPALSWRDHETSPLTH